MSLEAWLNDFVAHGTIVISHVLGSWLSGQNKGCHCSCHLGQSETDSRVLDILQHQLERCGPENLSAHSAGQHWILNFLFCIFLIVMGIVIGWAARGRQTQMNSKYGKDIDPEEDVDGEAQRALRIKLHGAAAW